MRAQGLKHYNEIVKIIFQYISLLRETEPQEWIFEEQKLLADVSFKYRQKSPAARFTSKTSAVMQKPLPREWLLSGQSRLRKFEPNLIKQALDMLCPENLRLNIISKEVPGTWQKKEKWYGTEYTDSKIPADLMDEFKAAWSVSSKDRMPELHLPHKNQFIPTKLEVEKKEVKQPAIAPRIVRNDALGRTWFKKDDRFWVPKASLLVAFRSPIIYASADNSVRARLYTDLVKDALEEYSYDADLAGLQYSVHLDTRGLLVEVSGYNDKLAVLLEQVLVTMRDLQIKDDRFNVVKDVLLRSYRNWGFQQPYYQLGYPVSLLTCEHDFTVSEMLAELPAINVDAVRSFHKELLSQLHMEVYVHGNLYKEDALMMTDMIASTLKPRALPRSQWPIYRSLNFPSGSNYVYEETLEDPENVNHAIEYLLHVGPRGNRPLTAKLLMFDQLTHEPVFDQLRTKEQLGYVVFSGPRSGFTALEFRFIIQSEKHPQYLESRIESFLVSHRKTLEALSDAEFAKNKRALVVKRTEKVKDLDQETGRHWNQICTEYFDFDYGMSGSLFQLREGSC